MCNATVTVVCAAITLSKPNASFPANGGAGSFTGTTAASCPWLAITSSPFIHLTAPRVSTSGTRTVSYTVDSHNGVSSRSGTIVVGDQTFTVLQGPQFADVPLNHPFYDFIGKLAARGITLGGGGGDFCPGSAVTRGQMAAFLVRAFNL
jgi:hypothetical protein